MPRAVHVSNVGVEVRPRLRKVLESIIVSFEPVAMSIYVYS